VLATGATKCRVGYRNEIFGHLISRMAVWALNQHGIVLFWIVLQNWNEDNENFTDCMTIGENFKVLLFNHVLIE
jgi:hypothetical protein